jgi:signal recognition particle GTPase
MARKKAESRQVELNSEELKDFLKHIITNNQYIQSQGKIPVSVSVTGEAGTGKTSSILELAQELDLQVVKLNLAQLEEIGD